MEKMFKVGQVVISPAGNLHLVVGYKLDNFNTMPLSDLGTWYEFESSELTLYAGELPEHNKAKMKRCHKKVIYHLGAALSHDTYNREIDFKSANVYAFWRGICRTHCFSWSWELGQILAEYIRRGYITVDGEKKTYKPTKKLAIAYYGREYLKRWNIQL